MQLNAEIKEVRTVEKVSAKTGKPYNVIEIEFKSGYVWFAFLNADKKYILEHQGK